jgi:predicted transglutaminase-like protease
MSVSNKSNVEDSIPKHIKVENEILAALKGFDRPVSPADIKLWTTNSKSVKSKAITRLIRRGFLKEERFGKYTRCISLTPKGNNK